MIIVITETEQLAIVPGREESSVQSHRIKWCHKESLLCYPCPLWVQSSRNTNLHNSRRGDLRQSPRGPIMSHICYIFTLKTQTRSLHSTPNHDQTTNVFSTPAP